MTPRWVPGWLLQTLSANATGYDIGLFFFAVNCALVAVLLARRPERGFGIPVLMSLAAAVYLVGSSLRIAAPEQLAAFQFAYVIPIVAELALCLWLLFYSRVPTRESQSARISEMGAESPEAMHV